MKKILAVLMILLVMAIVGISGRISSESDTSKPSINVTNVKAAPGEYGMHDVSGQIVPDKDIDYLEVQAIWYDSGGAVIATSPLLWNVNDAKAGQVYKFKGGTSLYQKGTPAKVDILIFDSVFSGGDTSKAIYKTTLNL
ncbi:MAG: hypothetical protein PQ964_03530 [Methanobacteriaceae archaeon]|jgi:hypothetical protein